MKLQRFIQDYDGVAEVLLPELNAFVKLLHRLTLGFVLKRVFKVVDVDLVIHSESQAVEACLHSVHLHLHLGNLSLSFEQNVNLVVHDCLLVFESVDCPNSFVRLLSRLLEQNLQIVDLLVRLVG